MTLMYSAQALDLTNVAFNQSYCEAHSHPSHCLCCSSEALAFAEAQAARNDFVRIISASTGYQVDPAVLLGCSAYPSRVFQVRKRDYRFWSRRHRDACVKILIGTMLFLMLFNVYTSTRYLRVSHQRNLHKKCLT